MIFPENIIDHEYQAVIGTEIKPFKLSQIKTKHILLVFYPLNFTFVCPTEITKLSDMHDEFIKEGCSIVYVSVDSVYSHLAWTKESADTNGIGLVKWPMVSDISHKLSSQFNLYSVEKGTCVRSSVIMDKKFVVKHISANIDPIGRSAKELLRLVKALNFHEEHHDICPVDFEKNN